MKAKINRKVIYLDQEKAALDPLDSFVQEAIDQDSQTDSEKVEPTESAPVNDAKEPEATEAEKPTEDGFQKRINKVTADKYAEKRRADDLQARLEKLEAANPAETLKEPKLDELDYDEDAFNSANVKYQIQQGVKSELSNQANAAKEQSQAAAADQLSRDFNKRIEDFGKDDFNDKANAIPNLPDGVADAMMQSDEGPAIIYHLGQHLDKADALAKMTPAAAMMELGKLSVQLSAKPEIKTSAAPDPIEPVTAGSALSTEIGDEMSIDAWMSKYN